ncbi:MAG: asparaginase domain-containing protein, partial [Flavobacteriales bacterium]
MRQSDSVLLIYTGGTIGMYKTNEGSLRPFDLDTLSTQIPELNTFDIDINAISIAQPIDSSNMSMWEGQNGERRIYDPSKRGAYAVLEGGYC